MKLYEYFVVNSWLELYGNSYVKDQHTPKSMYYGDIMVYHFDICFHSVSFYRSVLYSGSHNLAQLNRLITMAKNELN